MSNAAGLTRRDFVAAAGSAAVASVLPTRAAAAGPRRRYAIVGTGVRGIGMWGRPLVERYSDVLEFVGLCDVNPLRAEVAKQAIGVACPTFTSLDAMLDQAKPAARIGKATGQTLCPGADQNRPTARTTAARSKLS